MSKYEVQWQRVLRYLERVREINDGVEMQVTAERYADDVLAFFQNCYHLKDWLINDAAYSSKSGDEIEDYVRHTPCLALCADICNGTKHLLLKPRSRKTAHEPRFASRDIHAWEGGENHGKIALKLNIDHGGTNVDAFTLATECVEAWKRFLA